MRSDPDGPAGLSVGAASGADDPFGGESEDLKKVVWSDDENEGEGEEFKPKMKMTIKSKDEVKVASGAELKSSTPRAHRLARAPASRAAPGRGGATPPPLDAPACTRATQLG